jgi:hypothetical protein
MGHDNSFLDDESLMDNMEDQLAQKIISWLENISIIQPEDLVYAVKFVKFLNSNYPKSTLPMSQQVTIKIFVYFVKVLPSSNKLLLQTAKHIYSKEEKLNDQKK